MLGLHCQSWAQWLAEALDLPFTKLSVDGARAEDLVWDQLPRLRGEYDLGCLYIGVNDVRNPDWEAIPFAHHYEQALARISDVCERVVVATVPLDLGRPRAGAKVAEANAIVREAAAARGAAVADLDDLRGWRLVLPDAVHLTALGELEVAERAAAALSLSRRPRELAPDGAGRVGPGYVATYSRWLAKDHWRRLRERFPT